MARHLEGIRLLTYCRRLKLSKEAQQLVKEIRDSPPSRTPGARRGNMPVWYPSKKMQCIIKAESAKVEFAFLLQAEHDDTVLEFWDQPPAIQLEYRDRRNRIQRPLHTADYFIFGYQECGWIECKPAQELMKQAERRPHRYVLDKGLWRCPPGETFAAKYGLTYRVWSSEEINWAAQDNWLYLEDYYQDLERLAVPASTLGVLSRLADEYPGLTLADLRARASEIPADQVNIAIATHALYVDLASCRLSEPWRTPVFRTRRLSRALRGPTSQDEKRIAPTQDLASGLTQEGRELLERASDVDLATAVFRNRVIHPEHYHDEEQELLAERRAAVPSRTKRRWQQWYREAETRYGRGFLGLLPHYHNCGGLRQIDTQVITLIHQVLETHYDTVTQKPKRGAYGEYLKRSEELHLLPVSQWTFYREAQRHRSTYEQTLAREGSRAAYRFKDYIREPEKTLLRHGNYAWSLAHLDHTELDLMLCDSRTGQSLGKCWLTLLILAHPRRIAAYYLTFDPPSYRSCMMTLRLCVKRYGR